MKKKHLKLLTLVFLLAGLLFFVAPTAYAAECGGVETSIIDCPDGSDTGEVKDSGVWQLLITIINWLTMGVGIAVVAGIVFGAVRYITSDGNPGQAQQGMSVITNAIIGLLLYLFMYAIINFLVPGGLFNSSGNTSTGNQQTNHNIG